MILKFIFPKLLSLILLGQIWSQNLKFFKLTEICYRGRLICTYFDFDVYFFKIFAIHIFWTNLVAKSKVLQINWNLVQAHIFACLLWFQCLVFQNFVIHLILGKFGWNLMFSILIETWCKGTLLYADYGFDV